MMRNRVKLSTAFSLLALACATFATTLLANLVSAKAQTYTQMQWGMDKTATPYAFGANIGGTWRNLGTVTSGGAWAIPASNLSGVSPSVATNADLLAASTATYPNGVWRLTFSASIASGPVFYSASNSACSLNSGDGDNGSQVKSANGKCWIASLPTPADVRIWGAKLDGVTDDSAAANAALLASKDVQIPAGKALYAASTISVQPSGTLEGSDFNAGNYPIPTSSRVVCATAVSPCVQSIGGPNGTSNFRNLVVTRNGTPSSTAIGLLIQDNKNITLQNIVSLNHGICYKFQAQVYNTSAGIGAYAYNLNTNKCADAHLVNDSWPELRIFGGRFSSEAYTPSTFLRMQGGTAGTAGGPNTFTANGVHFGGGGYPTQFAEFVNLGSGGIGPIDAREFVFDGIHVENLRPTTGASFYSDSSWNYLERITITNSTFLTSNTPFLALDPATNIKVTNITGNRIFASSFTVAPTTEITGLNIADNWIQTPVSITAGANNGYGNITGNHFYGAATIAGAWARLNLCGNNVVSGAYTVSATGSVNRCDAGYTWSTGGQPLNVDKLSPTNGIYFSGSAPSCSITGAGTGATCAFSGSSNTNDGIVVITAGTGAATTGTAIVTFASTLGGSSVPVCIAGYDNTGTAWDAGAISPRVTANATTGVTFSWNNNAVALTNGSAYRIMYHCFGK